MCSAIPRAFASWNCCATGNGRSARSRSSWGSTQAARRSTSPPCAGSASSNRGEVLRRAARVEPQFLLERADRPFPVAQQLEDANARGMAEHTKEVCLHLVDRPTAVRHADVTLASSKLRRDNETAPSARLGGALRRTAGRLGDARLQRRSAPSGAIRRGVEVGLHDRRSPILAKHLRCLLGACDLRLSLAVTDASAHATRSAPCGSVC